MIRVGLVRLAGAVFWGLMAPTFAAELEQRVTPAQADAPGVPVQQPQPPSVQSQIQALDARISRIENILQNQAALDLLKAVEDLKAEVSRLRGQDEVQSHQLDTLTKRQSDLYVDLDKRIEIVDKQVKDLASAPPPAVVAVAAPPVADAKPETSTDQTQTQAQTKQDQAKVPPAQTKPAIPATDPLAESKAYESALNLFKTGNYSAAVTEFKSFLKSYPDSTLAPNAQYWTGYAYYAIKDYKNSLEQQKKVVSNWPQSSKVPDAMLNIASNQIELDDFTSAKKNLEEIVAKFPGTNAAAIAAKRLALFK